MNVAGRFNIEALFFVSLFKLFKVGIIFFKMYPVVSKFSIVFLKNVISEKNW